MVARTVRINRKLFNLKEDNNQSKILDFFSSRRRRCQSKSLNPLRGKNKKQVENKRLLLQQGETSIKLKNRENCLHEEVGAETEVFGANQPVLRKRNIDISPVHSEVFADFQFESESLEDSHFESGLLSGSDSEEQEDKWELMRGSLGTVVKGVRAINARLGRLLPRDLQEGPEHERRARHAAATTMLQQRSLMLKHIQIVVCQLNHQSQEASPLSKKCP